jgi:hypothetical protein
MLQERGIGMEASVVRRSWIRLAGAVGGVGGGRAGLEITAAGGSIITSGSVRGIDALGEEETRARSIICHG